MIFVWFTASLQESNRSWSLTFFQNRSRS